MSVKIKEIISVNTLSKSDYERCKEMASKMVYNVDVDKMQINVTQQQLKDALADPMVYTLKKRYNFSLQLSII